MRTITQAAEVAALVPGAVRLPGRTRPDGMVPQSRLVDIGPDFDAVRSLVEQVSVLYVLHAGDAAFYAASGEPGPEIPTGWTVMGARFEVEWPDDPAVVRSHFGARRFAYNWALARVKADLDTRKADPAYQTIKWSLGDLRKEWNQAKGQAAPWWAENSKEAYSSGISDLVTALGNWKSSRDGTRKGAKAGFPRFKSKKCDRGRVRFTTGTMRLEADRRTITVPVIGALRSMENTRRVQRHLASGRARILNLTVSERWGRLHVSVCYALFTPPAIKRRPQMPAVRAGVDLGLRVLATVIYTDPGTERPVTEEYQNPAPLRATLRERAKAGRQMSRRIPGSHGYQAAKAKLTRLDRKAVFVRQEAAHQLTASLCRRFGEIVIEDLDLAAMKKGMGRRAFRRSVSDTALGSIRPMLTYKAKREGGTVVVADRWFPSSQLHHGHLLPDGTRCRLAGLRSRLDKQLACPVTGELVDRDHNAAANLRDWPDMPVGAQLAPRPCTSAVPAVVPGTAARTHGAQAAGGPGSASKTTRQRAAMRSEARTNPPAGTPKGRNPARGAAA